MTRVAGTFRWHSFPIIGGQFFSLGRQESLTRVNAISIVFCILLGPFSPCCFPLALTVVSENSSGRGIMAAI